MAFIDKNKSAIISIINEWQGKLTWELLCSEVQKQLGLKSKPDRTSLYNDAEIYETYDTKKKSLRVRKKEVIDEAKTIFESGDKLSVILRKHTGGDDATIKELVKRVDKVERENESLKNQNATLEKQKNTLLERFARWQYNLSKMDGVDLNKLNQATLDEGLPQKNLR